MFALMRTSRTGSVPGVALLAAVLCACGGGAKNATPTATAAPTRLAVTTVATVAAQATATVQAITTTATATSTSKATSAATVAAAGTAAGGATPRSAASAVAAQPDPDLQRTLESAALKVAEMPAGYTQQGGIASPSPVGGHAADLALIFTRLPQGGNPAQSLLVTMVGYPDAATTANQFKSVTDQAVARAGASGGKAEPEQGAPQIGDQSAVYHLTTTLGSVSSDGHIIVWRRGRIGIVMSLTGLGNQPVGLDDLVRLAQSQDAKLKAAGL